MEDTEARLKLKLTNAYFRGFIIGKSGKTVSEVEKATGTSIELPPNTDLVYIRGRTLASVASAKSEIENIIARHTFFAYLDPSLSSSVSECIANVDTTGVHIKLRKGVPKDVGCYDWKAREAC